MSRRVAAVACIVAGLAGLSSACGASDRDVCTTPPRAAEPAALCAFSKAIDVVLDDQFNGAERAAVERAARAWNEATGDRVRITLTRDGDHATLVGARDPSGAVSVVRVTRAGDAALLAKLDAASGGYPMKGFTSDGRVYIAAERVGEGLLLQQIAGHELGHALGLAHVEDPDALMYPSSGEANACLRADPRPSGVDVEQLRREYCE